MLSACLCDAASFFSSDAVTRVMTRPDRFRAVPEVKYRVLQEGAVSDF